ncbi:hydroxyisourate hydrolase-like isoform X1 [Senna tora]|uniref:Hydroxyisourate hydrolase-like isoform X1 n=1 Tax=Senna tora TaxID=362788 RepID=A0A834SM24_9FABA|nr:hydroxyisourate hydrolase-like isoform X1 [Senna tora]
MLLSIFVLGGGVGVLSVHHYTRDDFPSHFIFGSATSAYQVEGAANQDGRTPTIWDTFAHAGHAHGHNGDVACDEYHKYKDDVQLMVETGLDAYRFSISWSRLIPNGRGPVNPKGLQYYNNLINELIKNGIEPHVTLFNFDLPQALEDEYGGWVSRRIIRDFRDYADVCFREFGDRVLYWTTVNEPNVFALAGYDEGEGPPLRCSTPFGVLNCNTGNSTFEAYLAAHHILLAHSSAATLYRTKYKDKQHGFIGIAVYTFGILPQTNTEKDILAVQRVHEFYVGWILDPLMYGDYPNIMKINAGSRIPAFTSAESKQLKGSLDFIGVIYYTNFNVTDNSDILKRKIRDFDADMAAQLAGKQDLFSEEEYTVDPWGLQQVLKKLKLLYGNPPIYIYENGQRSQSNPSLHDVSRVKYLHEHIGSVLDALRNGSNIRGYFAWSFMDLFELLDGYESGYGLYYVDRNDPDLKRYPKLSAHWYARFLRGTTTSRIGTIQLDKDPSLLSLAHLFQ